jgi:hypothetical protein
MTMTTRRLPAIATALVLGWALAGLAQGTAKPKDGDLDDLLKKIDDASKPKATSPSEPSKPGGVAPKDKDLDDFLDKIGEEKDKPSADGKPPESAGSASDDMKPDQKGGKGDKSKKDQSSKGGDSAKPKKDDGLTGDDKDLEEHLTGADRKKQQRNRQGQGQGQRGQKQGEEDGPLGDLIKQMREVEQRLGKPDTGEETRQKQTQIVKRLDGLIEQMRLVRSQSQMMRMMRQNQQGQQQGQQATNNPQEGVGLQKPATPRPKSVLALDKNAWGHLPPSLRDEMDNVSKEAPLPQKDDLIKRYYLSVAKKSLSREE